MQSQSTGTTGPHVPDLQEWIACAPFEQLLHMQIDHAADGAATLSMPFLYDHAQGAGLMHGGALVSLADTALVMAIKSVLPPATHFATINLKASYLKGVTRGVVTAKARLTGCQDRQVNGVVDVYNEVGEPVLAFEAEFRISRQADLSKAALDKIPPAAPADR